MPGNEPRNSEVYAELRAMVVSSAFRPGTRIRIDELAAQLDTGRTPLREALFQLSSENLVRFRYQQGFWTPEISTAELKSLVTTKTALEDLLILDPQATRGDRWEQDLLVAFHVFARSRPFSPQAGYADNRGWLEAHRLFHRALVAGSPNDWAIRMADILDANIDRYRSHILGRDAGDLGDRIDRLNEVEAHRGLHDLAMERDFEALAANLREHNARTSEVFAAYLARQPAG